MLEVALIELVSAGLRRFFVDGTDDAATAESSGGAELIRRLLLAEPEAAGRLMNRCVTDLWQNVRSVGLPQDHAEAHIRILPAILAADSATPDPAADHGAAFFAQSPAALADAIILAHRIETDPDRLDDTVLTFLLETFLKSLHACRADIETLIPRLGRPPPAPAPTRDPTGGAAPDRAKPGIDAERSADSRAPHLQAAAPAAASASSRSPSAVMLEKIARADALSVSVPILELVTVALINQTRSPDLRQADIEAAAAEARAIRAELAILAADQPFAIPELGHLLTAFDAARFEACNRILTAIEDAAVKRATACSPRVAAEVERAIAMRLLRARLHGLAGAHVAAARQFGNAQRHVARTDHARHWQLAAREGRHYERAALHERTPANLEHAARTCSSLLASLTGNADAELGAEVQSELAYFLIRLGEFEQSAPRFEIAAQLLADALAHLDPARAPAARLRALIRKADALTALAGVTGATHLIDLAVEACLDASRLLVAAADDTAACASPARRPFDESVTALRARLAIALTEAPSTHNDAALRATALETIIDVLPDLTRPRDLAEGSSFSAPRLAALCHQVIAQRLAAAGQPQAARDLHDTARRILCDAGLDALARSLEPPAAAGPAGAEPVPSAASAA